MKEIIEAILEDDTKSLEKLLQERELTQKEKEEINNIADLASKKAIAILKRSKQSQTRSELSKIRDFEKRVKEFEEEHIRPFGYDGRGLK